MKGYIVVSEGRSGTNWLGSMADATGVMGVCNEWLNLQERSLPIRKYDPDSIFEDAIRLGTTENERFSIKIFPWHMHWVHDNFGFDFLQKCLDEHESIVIFLRRRDRLGQAISLVRGRQTGQWSSEYTKDSEPTYDFNAIAKAFYHIGRSYAFWESYLDINQVTHSVFYYEDLLNDPKDYLNSLAKHLGVDCMDQWETPLKIQRDNKTELWRQRFLSEKRDHNMVLPALRVNRTPRTLWNLAKLIANQHFTKSW